jgi:glycerol-3-phosphate dehydrogenase (NAD(P)+)
MKKEILRVTVAGGGSWGTALAHLLAGAGHEVTLWARDASVAEAVNAGHENPRYLPGRALHPSLAASGDTAVFSGRDLVLLAVPCRHMRGFLEAAAARFTPDPVVVNASKGLEPDALRPVSVLLREILRPRALRYAVLSGPSFADEVLDGQPTAVVLASEDEKLSRRLCRAFSTRTFRCYAGTDVIGVEFGGAVKNVMAIAAGLCDGLGLGHNSRAALITRGLAEISRLGRAMGARPDTFMGLSGLGDLVLTCAGDLSRNRRAGLALAEGRSPGEIAATLGSTAEGLNTAPAVFDLARKLRVETPIVDAVCAILREERTPWEAMRVLMGRELKEE